jgi:hypothetical protein
MQLSQLNYLPATLPFFAVLAGVFLVLLVLIQVQALSYVYARLGISPPAAMLLLLGSLGGSYFNIPIARRSGPAEVALGVHRRALLVRPGEDVEDDVAVGAVGDLVEVLAGRVVVELARDLGADQAQPRLRALVAQLQEADPGQNARRHLGRIEIAAVGHRPAAPLPVPIGRKAEQHRLAANGLPHSLALLLDIGR